MEKIEVCEGKYSIIFDENTGEFKAFRYGDPFKDLVGDKFTFALFVEIQKLRKEIERMQGAV